MKQFVGIFADCKQVRLDLLTEFALEPNEESFSEDIPLKLALETDYSWAAMDDTSKKVSELTHLAPTVCHANKV